MSLIALLCNTWFCEGMQALFQQTIPCKLLTNTWHTINNRYSDVAKVLQAKAKLTDPVVPHIDRKEGLAQDLLFYNIARNDPEHYVQSYNRFASWVDNSLEQYRVCVESGLQEHNVLWVGVP